MILCMYTDFLRRKSKRYYQFRRKSKRYYQLLDDFKHAVTGACIIAL